MTPVCGTRRSQRLVGKLSAVPASTLRKWALKFPAVILDVEELHLVLVSFLRHFDFHGF